MISVLPNKNTCYCSAENIPQLYKWSAKTYIDFYKLAKVLFGENCWENRKKYA
jgi:hypothetical protein